MFVDFFLRKLRHLNSSDDKYTRRFVDVFDAHEHWPTIGQGTGRQATTYESRIKRRNQRLVPSPSSKTISNSGKNAE